MLCIDLIFPFCLYQNKTLKSKVTSQSKQVDKLENQVIRGLLLFRLVKLTFYIWYVYILYMAEIQVVQRTCCLEGSD